MLRAFSDDNLSLNSNGCLDFESSKAFHNFSLIFPKQLSNEVNFQ